MLTQINGLHHVTTIGSDAAAIDRFWTGTLGLRRVKKTVNFDAPEIYHLYYGDALGRPGTAMTYFPFPGAARGQRGAGEVEEVRLSIPEGAATHWSVALDRPVAADPFGAPAVAIIGPDGDAFRLVETSDLPDPVPGTAHSDRAIRGFHSVAIALRDIAPVAELLRFMGYVDGGTNGTTSRYIVAGGRANIVDLVSRSDAPVARQGAGSVHHVAFSVDNRARQLEAREALVEQGFDVTPVIDRDYFHAIYFRAPGGVLFEIATDEPGFDRDETPDSLGTALKLPARHEHLRERLEKYLAPLDPRP